MIHRNYLSLCLFALLFTAKAQWNANTSINTPVCNAIAGQKNLVIVSDTKGGAIMAWSDARMGTGFDDIYAQRISSQGFTLWPANGIAVCNNPTDQSSVSAIEDGAGGIILAWNDLRSGNSDIYAQKVDSNGTVQWTINGVSVVSKIKAQISPKLISDGGGGAIVVWQDSINGLWDIYAQRINSSGSALWTAGGISICNSAGNQINPKLQPDGQGGAIITWQDKRTGVDYDIYAQRINSSGVVQWSANGLVICNAINTQSNPKLRSDGVGGATIAWQDKRGGIDYDVYAQRISSTGSLQWTANGIAVTAVAGAQSAVDMTNESLGTDIIITWKDDRNGNYDIYAQKLDALGNALWMANGLALTASASNQVNPNAVGDGAGGAIITWQDTVIDYDIYAQRVDLSGNLLWGGNGIAVANAIDDQTSPKNVSDGTGGSIFVWEDHRNGTDMDVYAQRISAAGIPLGLDQYKGPDQALVTSNYPNPFAASTTIRITGTDHSSPDLSVNITDLLGKAQKFSVTRSGNEFSINAENMGSGTYIYKIFSGKAVIGTGKLTVIK